MEMWGWVIVILAVALIGGAISLAWRAFSRPMRVRSPEMRKLEESYFNGDINREEYLRRKAELERRESA